MAENEAKNGGGGTDSELLGGIVSGSFQLSCGDSVYYAGPADADMETIARHFAEDWDPLWDPSKDK